MDEPRSLDHLLAQVNRLHGKRGHQMFKGKNFHPRQFPLLAMLSETNGKTHSELAARMCVSAPTVTKGVQRLEARDLVQRRADPDDERVSRVFITDAGREALVTMESVLDEMDRDLDTIFSEEERAELFRLLLKLRDHYEDILAK